MSIKVPDIVSRPPKTLCDYEHWKGSNTLFTHRFMFMFFTASEFRNWILYFSIPVLHGVLPDPYFSHFSLLVGALQLLSSSVVTKDDLNYAGDCIMSFLSQFTNLYGMWTLLILFRDTYCYVKFM